MVRTRKYGRRITDLRLSRRPPEFGPHTSFGGKSCDGGQNFGGKSCCDGGDQVLKNMMLFFFKFSTLRGEGMGYFGSSRIKPGAVFLRIFTVAFLLFLAPAGGL